MNQTERAAQPLTLPAVEDKSWAEQRLGPERVRGAYAWRSLRRTGARLAFNSDLPDSDHGIFYGLHAAMHTVKASRPLHIQVSA